VPIAPDILAGVARRLADHAGLEPPAWVVEARASARIAALGCLPEDYLALIESGRGANELSELIEAVRVGESRLFRHRPQIETLVDVVAPALRARGRRPIKVWSAGCAAGEEPYTLAVVLARELPGWRCRSSRPTSAPRLRSGDQHTRQYPLDDQTLTSRTTGATGRAPPRDRQARGRNEARRIRVRRLQRIAARYPRARRVPRRRRHLLRAPRTQAPRYR
jgi:hypothetical protein